MDLFFKNTIIFQHNTTSNTRITLILSTRGANTFLLPRAFSFFSFLLAYYQCVAGQGNRRHAGAAACV